VISYEEALHRLLTRITVLPGRLLDLPGASGLVTSSVISARLSVPGFANAAMDGYVLRAEAARGATPETPVQLAVSGLIAAGGPAPRVQGAVVWEILTGAPVPAGLDAVVPLERVTRREATDGAGPWVLITAPLHPGQNIRQTGEDFVRGQAVVDAGTRLGPHHLMALAACGVDEVPVVPAPRVAVLTTGNELTEQGADLAPGHIRDANGPYLRSLLPLLGAEVTTLATAPDSAAELRERLRALAAGADVVLTTGGVSAGRLDLLPAVVRELGGEVLFHKVAIRPGKPVLHARLPGGALLFCLPGNPLAVAVGMRFFVIPALRALQGLASECALPAVTTENVRGRDTLRFFAKAFVEMEPTGRRRVRILPGQESFRIAPLLKANCWAIVPEGAAEIPAGGTLWTLPLYPDS
jgi:molybdopterin molybdotransferase